MAAERLYTNLNDDDYLDTLSWICRLLGLSGTDRYRATLEYVIANADARKLRKYAQKALKRTTTGSGVQYQAGDVLKL